jgi:hypothetical protein
MAAIESHAAMTELLLSGGKDGTGRKRVIRDPVMKFQSVSPHGERVTAQVAVPSEDTTRGVFAYSTRDQSRILICRGLCFPSWSPDGKTFILGLLTGMTSSAGYFTTFAIPLVSHKVIPALPDQGIKSEEDIRGLKGFKVTDGVAYFASDTSVYAYTRSSIHRNLYRIPVPSSLEQTDALYSRIGSTDLFDHPICRI